MKRLLLTICFALCATIQVVSLSAGTAPPLEQDPPFAGGTRIGPTNWDTVEFYLGDVDDAIAYLPQWRPIPIGCTSCVNDTRIKRVVNDSEYFYIRVFWPDQIETIYVPTIGETQDTVWFVEY